MINKLFKSVGKYWVCILLSVTIAVGIFLSTHYADLYVVGSDMIRFDLSTLYLIYVMPLCSLIYGTVSYVALKKIWLPQLILYIVIIVGFAFNNFLFDREVDAIKNILIVSVYPIIFSLIGTYITVLIYKLIKVILNKTQK